MPRHLFVRGDIGDRTLVASLLATHRPRAIVNFAAETHVDRSIHGPAAFIETNVVGTFALLEVARAHCATLAAHERAQFRFLHVSTDEVFGSLGPRDAGFSRNDRVRAQQSVFGVESRGRSSGARLSPYLRRCRC